MKGGGGSVCAVIVRIAGTMRGEGEKTTGGVGGVCVAGGRGAGRVLQWGEEPSHNNRRGLWDRVGPRCTGGGVDCGGGGHRGQPKVFWENVRDGDGRSNPRVETEKWAVTINIRFLIHIGSV